MARLGFLAHGLAQGLIGAQKGREDAENTAYTRNTRQAEMQDRRDRSQALAEYNDSIAQSRRIEAEARLKAAQHDAANDELTDEERRLQIARLRAQQKNGWRNEPGQREVMMREAMHFRDQKVREGMKVEEANRLMKQQYPLLGGTTMEDILMGMLQNRPGGAPAPTAP